MKRVLLVSYAFPPDPLPGALRPGFLARHLPDFGWEVTVLTACANDPPFEADVVHTGTAVQPGQARRIGAILPKDGALRSLLRAVKDAVVFPDELAGWIPHAVRAGRRLLAERRYDAILTTALPTSVHVVGACLSKLSGVPWLADYRDLWSGNPHMPWGPVKQNAQRLTERCVLRQAAHISTISEALAEPLRSMHGKGVSVIENAVDTAVWDGVPDEPPVDFNLVYTGTMYGGKRSAEPLFRALAQLRDGGDPAACARVHFYGPGNEHVPLEARRFGVESQVEVHGVVPRAQALSAQRRAAGLLVFLSMHPAAATETGSKYLEYLGAERPMIVFGQEGPLRRIIASLGAGYFTTGDVETREALREVYRRFQTGGYRISPRLDAVQTAEKLAAQFAQCLNTMTSLRVKEPHARERIPAAGRH